MFKTDKVIYRTRTQREYDWLMQELDEAGCGWASRVKLLDFNLFCEYGSGFCVRLENKKVKYADFKFYKNDRYYKDYEFIEVSDLMENEKKTTNELIEQEDKQRKLKR
ncbi:hypothetical protein HMPREF1635_02085 [Clostridiales bacterium S5-A14a]|nr:hypothetical protein HMPREF1635_02085 [Clostridiales bacterium S5-A14a]